MNDNADMVQVLPMRQSGRTTRMLKAALTFSGVDGYVLIKALSEVTAIAVLKKRFIEIAKESDLLIKFVDSPVHGDVFIGNTHFIFTGYKVGNGWEGVPLAVFFDNDIHDSG
jgi:hypothetical protein